MRNNWRFVLTSVLITVTFHSRVSAQAGSVTGIILDSLTNTPVNGVQIELQRGGAAIARTSSDRQGRFALESLEDGTYELIIRRIDYRITRISSIAVAGGMVDVGTVLISPLAYSINPVIVSASRTEQKALDAPASVSVIERAEIEERPALTSIDHVLGTPGIDVATTGLTQHEVVARGFNNVSSTSLLTLTDNRYASLPSLRINVYNFIPMSDDDVDRIELVRGPGAALYGPNSAAGVMHIVSRSPFDSRGTTVTLGGGGRSLIMGTLRHASVLGESVGLKLSGLYQRGNDWPYADPIEEANRQAAIAGGADPDTLLIGLREEHIERLGGEARVDWRITPRSTLKVTGGLNHAFRNVDVTSVGATQVRDWQAWYLQTQFTHGRLFAQAFLNQSDAGSTYLLRTAAPIVDRSRMLVGQIQHGALLGSTNLTYGIDAQRTEPRTGGTITGRNEDDDIIDEVGGYLHTETQAGIVQIVAAIRGDWHNRLPDPVFSPRAALVVQPNADHTLRLTYNRAFATPSVNNLFLDLVADSVFPPIGPALPYAIRVYGVPEGGLSFRRDCNGLCMRSPFTPDNLGGPGTYIPTDGTLVWDNIVDTLAARTPIDLSAIPAPTAADVNTNVLLVDGVTGALSPVDQLIDIDPLRPGITNGFELGYRGVIGDRLFVGVDVYHERKNDFVGPLRIETPNAFLDSTTLANYLGNYMPIDTARFLSGLASQLPVGTVSPQEARDPWDVIITYRNFGDISLWGADFELGVFVTPELVVAGTYSWVSDDLFEDPSGLAVPLNAPKHKGSLRVTYRSEDLGLYAEVRGRAVTGFPVNSGVYIGDVEGYAVFDAHVGYRLPWARNITVTLSGQNIFDHRHAEFIGTPQIGRLIMGRVRAEF